MPKGAFTRNPPLCLRRSSFFTRLIEESVTQKDQNANVKDIQVVKENEFDMVNRQGNKRAKAVQPSEWLIFNLVEFSAHGSGQSHVKRREHMKANKGLRMMNFMEQDNQSMRRTRATRLSERQGAVHLPMDVHVLALD
ncbi:hypothetical protein P152DRAFT_141557 [Eremomyces bilateralis CBS 781.70]|uniref:Uncharacterized protein n=1 Tax=Eremomyces bilateralis CBS 781.70 TaxID=1392243 RepID=A0A6G1FVR3_9PEZI|nr:uncharacterized protein P152DRAFT_141557 [Eremomyces bilateralis CBS 781.70]KAF1809863.1 hypothetical protein P152DRAFT_141557 [Eremomyces bilateralis CBS 781.70]